METLQVSTVFSFPSLVLLSVTLLVLYVTHQLYRWQNPKCKGRLPPGSMGLPFIGETIPLIIPGASFDLPPFLNKRFERYGPIFRTHIARRPVIFTADPEFNLFLLREDGKLIESWSLDTFRFDHSNLRLQTRKYMRNSTLHHFGAEALRATIFPQLEVLARNTLSRWAGHDSVEVKSESFSMGIDFGARQVFGEDLERTANPLKLSDMYRDFPEGILSFPINIPGTAHYRNVQIQKNVKEVIRRVVTKRLAEAERHHGDLLDQIISDMETESFLNQEFIVQMLFGLLFAASESLSTSLTLAFKLLEEHPLVLEELTAEHEGIIQKREKPDSALTWDEYKSMRYTRHVINEVLRLGNPSPGMFRRAITDISFNGYTIPAGWGIIITTSGLHLSENRFEDPLKFNPRRWEEVEPSVLAKCYMPFGMGARQCTGEEYARVAMSTFLHVMVTKYRWSIVKGGKIARNPTIRFPDGFHYKLTERRN